MLTSIWMQWWLTWAECMSLRAESGTVWYSYSMPYWTSLVSSKPYHHFFSEKHHTGLPFCCRNSLDHNAYALWKGVWFSTQNTPELSLSLPIQCTLAWRINAHAICRSASARTWWRTSHCSPDTQAGSWKGTPRQGGKGHK